LFRQRAAADEIRGILVTASASTLGIGGHNLPGCAFLAPMAGITDRPMRILAERYGASLVVSEMIASNALAAGQQEMERKLRRSGRLPHMVQLAGCEAQWMRRGAEIAYAAGADIIDINFGCPAKRVTNGYAGSALMRVPDEAVRLVEAVVTATPLPVTVKMRLGWDDTSLNAPDFARRVVAAGAQMVTVHGRTRQQFYKGTARWQLVRPVVEAVEVPVVVNGDIADAASAREALALSGAAAVMIGRGAQGQPWVVGQIAAALAGRPGPMAPANDDLADVVDEHYLGVLEEYGVAVGVRAARKHLDWYLQAAGIVPAREARWALLNSAEPNDVRQMIRRLFRTSRREAA
jgi:nifR3 family TIM-barrel protein